MHYTVLVLILTSMLLSCSRPPDPVPTLTIQTAAPAAPPPKPNTALPPTQPPLTIEPALTFPTPAATVAVQPAPVDLTLEMLTRFDPDRALVELRKLTGEDAICTKSGCSTVATRKTGSEGLGRIKTYLASQLEALGYAVEVQDWSRSGYADQNILAVRPGTELPDEKIYFVAHMDAVAKNPLLRYPGADDNASGVAAVLEMAKVLSGYALKRTVVLFLSTGEEQSALGVKSYLSQLTPAEISAIKAVINLDMLGYDADGDAVMQFFHGDHPASAALANTIVAALQDYQVKLAPQITAGCG